MEATVRRNEMQRELVVLGTAVIVAALFVGWLLVRSDGATQPQTTAPTLVSQAQLERFAQGRTVYWAGPRTGYSYELTVTPSGRVYVRYLPEGVHAGDPRASFLTVGTYPADHAYASLRHAATAESVTSKRTSDGGLAVVSDRAPASAYLAYPGSKLQVEVYEPDADKALGLVLSGSVVPVD
jgi:hypothetical protein